MTSLAKQEVTDLIPADEMFAWCQTMIAAGQETCRDWIFDAVERNRQGALSDEDAQRLMDLGQSIITVKLLLEDTPVDAVALILTLAPTVLASIGVSPDGTKSVGLALATESGESLLAMEF